MPRTKISKKKVTLTLDRNMLSRLKKSNINVSGFINHLLYKHYSQISKPQSHALITPRSLVQIQPSLFLQSKNCSF